MKRTPIGAKVTDANGYEWTYETAKHVCQACVREGTYGVPATWFCAELHAGATLCNDCLMRYGVRKPKHLVRVVITKKATAESRRWVSTRTQRGMAEASIGWK